MGLAQRILEQTVVADFHTIHLVTRPWVNVTRTASDERVHIIMNPAPEQGMSSSIRLGVQSAQKSADGAMIILADQPFQNARIFDTLIAVFKNSPGCIVAPTVNGRRTHPVIFPKEFFAALTAVLGDKGGRRIIADNPRSLILMELGSLYDDMDVDSPEDFTSYIEKLK